jgi:RsiW-degrading membrane proteinase PrsW (M82 family)
MGLAQSVHAPDENRSKLSWFELAPVLAPKTRIWEHGLFWPGLLTAIMTCYLIFVDNAPDIYFRVVAYYIVAMIVIIFYVNSGTQKRWPALIMAGLITALIIWVPQIMNSYYVIVRHWPGGLEQPAEGAGFLQQFYYYFVDAGLVEELMKATPLLIGLAITLAFFSQRPFAREIVNRLGVRNPMDGVMMGIAAGGAFTLVETLELYVHNVNHDAAELIRQLGSSLAVNLDEKTAALFDQFSQFAADNAGFNKGIVLLLPRILGALVGHMSYAALFGYFIGLAALYRSKIALLIPLGWILAATVHGAWDAVASLGRPYLVFLVAIISFLLFFIYFVKARALIPETDKLAGAGGVAA